MPICMVAASSVCAASLARHVGRVQGREAAAPRSAMVAEIRRRRSLRGPARLRHLRRPLIPSPKTATRCDNPAMTSVREAKPKRAKATRPPGKLPDQVRGHGRRTQTDATLLDPLAPPDAFAPLATERLILRPLVPEDAEALHRLVNDWEV